MDNNSNLLEVSPPEQFFSAHEKCMINITKAFQTEQSKSDIALVFLNTYKIHIELVDATIELLRVSHLSHITSSMIVRSVFENLATFKHICEADEAVAKKYLKKSEIFKKLTYKQALSILEKGGFANLSRFDDSKTAQRVDKLSDSAKMTYDMLSAYTHISPFITTQMKVSPNQINIAKRNNLQAVYMAYMSLLFYAHSSEVYFEDQVELINIFKVLLEDGERQGVYVHG